MCSLQRRLGYDTQTGITYRETCNVNLCKTCFKYFHITLNIARDKKSLARKCNKDHADMLKNK